MWITGILGVAEVVEDALGTLAACGTFYSYSVVLVATSIADGLQRLSRLALLGVFALGFVLLILSVTGFIVTFVVNSEPRWWVAPGMALATWVFGLAVRYKN